MSIKTGIYKSETDKVQPWRVRHKGYIIWFARTEEEAKLKFTEAKRKG